MPPSLLTELERNEEERHRRPNRTAVDPSFDLVDAVFLGRPGLAIDDIAPDAKNDHRGPIGPPRLDFDLGVDVGVFEALALGIETLLVKRVFPRVPHSERHQVFGRLYRLQARRAHLRRSDRDVDRRRVATSGEDHERQGEEKLHGKA